MSARLPPRAHEWLDRGSRLHFEFEGKTYTGYAGDTISSALCAAGVKVLGRSFKYHRPRGILSFANHDINALMQDGARLNVRADVTTLEDGMRLRSVNTWGGVARDKAALLNRLAAFLPVGFYYKAFYSKRLFPLWEKMFRCLTGLGQLNLSTARIYTAKHYDFCDVLVVGGGAAGLNAALAAAEAGCDVVLVDENSRLGGSALHRLHESGDQLPLVRSLIEQISRHARIRVYTATLAAAYYADHLVALVHARHMSKMRARTLIVAAGNYEQPAVFRNNDLPGIMLASAAQRLIQRYAVRPFDKVVVLAANRAAYYTSLDLISAGIHVCALVDLRLDASDNDLAPDLEMRGVTIYRGHCIYEAIATRDGKGVKALTLCTLDAKGLPQLSRKQTLTCDGVVMSVGYAPAANLLYQAGTRMGFDATLQQFIPAQLAPGIFACGQVNGVFEIAQRMLDGQRAGLAAAQALGLEVGLSVALCTPAPMAPTHAWPIVAHPKGMNFVDWDEDIQLKDFYHAMQEGFDNIELLKRFTTVGMGPSQGKHANMNALRVLARALNQSPDRVGTTTARPFVQPVSFAHLAGRGFTPQRRTPIHQRHNDHNAKFMPAGVWLRPEYYARPGLNRSACIQEEVASVRNRVGLIDVGTLGKFELRGPDAAEFLERIYISRYANLKTGMSRYAVMCDESGVVIDDGVVARVAEDYFYFTTTTAGAAPIYRELSRYLIEWQLRCGLTQVTGARAAINLAGPQARAVLRDLTEADLDPARFPYLGVREMTVAGINALVMRVGFVGEWGYEIHVSASYGAALWDALMQAGAAYGIRPFGVEAQRQLRLEKGHIIIGQDTDGLSTPFSAGLAWALKMDKAFFVGQRSLQVHAARPAKQKLIGFILDTQYEATPPLESHLIIHAGEIAGHVSSIGWSASLGAHIGLAQLRDDLCWEGARLEIRLSNQALVRATVCKTPFYDPENLRQKVAA